MIYSICFSEAEDLAAEDSTQVASLLRRVLKTGPFGAQFGGPGIRVHTFGAGRPRQQQAQPAQPQVNSSVFYQLLPVLILLAFTIIPTLFAGPLAAAKTPSFVFEEAQPPYTDQRTTPQHSI